VLRGAESEIAQQLKLQPGECAIVRPDLHHAGCVPTAQVRAALGKMFQ
jgi:hypothetical protein